MKNVLNRLEYKISKFYELNKFKIKKYIYIKRNFSNYRDQNWKNYNFDFG